MPFDRTISAARRPGSSAPTPGRPRDHITRNRVRSRLGASGDHVAILQSSPKRLPKRGGAQGSASGQARPGLGAGAPSGREPIRPGSARNRRNRLQHRTRKQKAKPGQSPSSERLFPGPVEGPHPRTSGQASGMVDLLQRPVSERTPQMEGRRIDTCGTWASVSRGSRARARPAVCEGLCNLGANSTENAHKRDQTHVNEVRTGSGRTSAGTKPRRLTCGRASVPRQPFTAVVRNVGGPELHGPGWARPTPELGIRLRRCDPYTRHKHVQIRARTLPLSRAQHRKK